MKITKRIIAHTKLSKSFVVLAFLLSIFSFSGFAGNSINKENKITQTELVISPGSRSKKDPGTYKFTASLLHVISCCTISKENLLDYSRLTIVRFKWLAKLRQKRNHTVLFTQNKLLPKKQNEDPLGVYTIG